jgi:pimeloyl-ACP methyl ester carboxylesterase
VAGIDLYGGVTVSEQTRGLRIPKLFMAGEVDGEAGDLLRVFEETAPDPNEVVTLDTGEHGTDILAYAAVAVAEAFRQAVLDFLARI